MGRTTTSHQRGKRTSAPQPKSGRAELGQGVESGRSLDWLGHLDTYAVMAEPLDSFVAAAADHGRHTVRGDARKTNSAYRDLHRARQALRAEADEGESAFLALLDHPDASVGDGRECPQRVDFGPSGGCRKRT